MTRASHVVSLCCVVVLVLAAFDISAQNPPKRVRDVPVLRVRVRVMNVGLRATDVPSLHWVLTSLPTEEDVLATDPVLKERLKEGVRMFDGGADHCQHWTTQRGPQCSYTFEIEKAVRKSNNTFAVSGPSALLSAPTNVDQSPAGEQLLAGYIPAAPRQISGIAILVSTFAYAKSNPSERKVVPYTIGTVPVTLQFATADSRIPSFETVLMRIASDLLSAANARGFKPNTPFPTGPELTKASVAESTAYDLDKLGWRSRVRFEHASEDENVLQLSVDDLHFISRARVCVEQNVEGMSPEGNEKLRRQTERIDTQVNERQRGVLVGLEGKVATAELVGRAQIAIAADPAVTGKVTPKEAPDGSLCFQTNPRWHFSSLDASVSANVSFNPEQLFTGQGSVRGDKLLRLGETESFVFQGGPAVQTANLDLNFERDKETYKYGLLLGGFFTRNSKEHLGAATVTEFTDREGGFTPMVFVEFRRETRLVRSTGRLEAGGDLRNVLVSLNNSKARLVEGQLSAAKVKLEHVLAHDFGRNARPKRPALGEISTRAQISMMKAGRALGGDFDFLRYEAVLGVQAFFGVRSKDDFFLRYQRGCGATGAATPIFQLFRLGGADSVRGIERGEFVGRGMAMEQLEFGVSMRPLWTRIGLGKKQSDSGTSETSTAAFPLADSYIKLFYDRARLSDSARFGDLLDLAHSQHGFGMAVEVRNFSAGGKRANLSLGYAFSPASVLHRHGVFSTAISFDF